MFTKQVGILGNAADFHEDGSDSGSMDNMDRRQMMIAFDMRYGLGNCHLSVKYVCNYIMILIPDYLCCKDAWVS